jgi:hypothetical protein
MAKTVRILQTFYRLITSRSHRSGPCTTISSHLALIASLTPIILIISRNMIQTLSRKPSIIFKPSCMRHISGFLIALLLLALHPLQAQVAINTDASTPDPSAMLDVKSTTKGVLIPRMSSVQRLAIAAGADGLMVYDTDTKSFWYYLGGTGWTQLANTSGLFTLPYSATLNSGLTLFALTNPGTGMAISGSSTGTTGIYGSTGTVSGAGLLADNLSGGEAVTGRTLTVSGTPTGAVVGRNDGPGYGTYGFIATDNSGVGIAVLGQVGISGSTGVAGHFENLNASNAMTALEAVTNGTGSASTITNTNSSNIANALYVTTNSEGDIPDHTQGNAGNFFNNNTNGVGAGVRGEVNSIFGNNGTAGVYGNSSGTGGYGGYFDHTNATGFGIALFATNAGLGVCAHVENTNASDAQNAFESTTNGTGSAANITNTNSANTSNALSVTTNTEGDIPDHTQGNAGNFFNNNTNGVGAGVRGEVNSIFGNNGTAGVYGNSSGTGGYGGYFDHTNATGFGIALFATNAGLGVCTHLENTNASDAQDVFEATTNGTGISANISNTNNANTSNTLYVTTNGPGVIADHSQGNAGSFFMNNTNGVGAGVRGEVNSIFGNIGTAGVYGVSSGTGGYAGYFEHTNSTGFGISLQAVNDGQGTVLVCDQEGSSGDLAAFQVGGTNVARISRAGKGFFDGGTQNSGADLAEAFAVEGSPADYEPGDVLLISTTTDRTVVKSNEAYSTLVAGIYATKPGVLLTEDHVAETSGTSSPASPDNTLSGKIPMGVIGVIPTKVCNEGGVIRRGDILVTASRPGYAMKADLDKLKPGQAIGKALEEFNGITGKIRVLVNVK